MRWYRFTWGRRIKLIFRICDFQFKRLPMMYHMLIYLKFFNLYSIKDLRFEMVYLHIRMSDHGGFQNLIFPSQDFPMMYLMLVYLKLLYSLQVQGFEGWDGLISHEDVGSWWFSGIVISRSRAFHWCIICWFIWFF